MMMVLRATVHFASGSESSVGTILSQTNRVMFDNSPAQFYVTFFFGDLDIGTGKMRYINAGHIPPIFYRAQDRSIERLETGGTVLGLFPDAAFEVGEVQFEKGDILVVFTDGLSESWGDNELEFGEERLGEIVRVEGSLSAADSRTEAPERSGELHPRKPRHRRPNGADSQTGLKSRRPRLPRVPSTSR